MHPTTHPSTEPDVAVDDLVSQVEIAETNAPHAPGGIALMLLFLATIGAVAAIIFGGPLGKGDWLVVTGAVVLVVVAICSTGFMVISPGDTRVVQFFGRYIGTIRRAGLLLTVPLVTHKKVSVKVHNFETNELKVNDADGNPVNIAAIVVWQVADTAKCVFRVEDYEAFVAVQAESALRHVAGSHPYDNAGPGEETLRGSTEVIAQELSDEVAARIAIAGLEIIETRISSLAYAPEIAQAMLQRQQATAIIAAREKIVEGAVGMVEAALARLEAESVVELDEERKAAMVSNLLVVLCGESKATPVINTGSLYN